jgi:D-alanine-D-alanine ligase
MKITVLYNTEDKIGNQSIMEADEDTELSANDLAKNLKQCGYQSEVLGINYDQKEKIRSIKSDLVFNLLEWSGKHTEDAVEAIKILEEMKIPFTGSDHVGYELSSNKTLMKKAMEENGILTPKWESFDGNFKGVMPEFKYPVIVKPALEHCGIGVDQNSVVGDETRLREKIYDYAARFQTEILVEEYIDGRELHVTILERYGRPWVLPPGEVVFSKKDGYWPIVTYDAKWRESSPEWELSEMVLAKIDDILASEIDRVGKLAYEKLGGRDYPRLDVRVRGHQAWVLEINNNPGIDFDIQSGIGVSARAVGFDYPALLKHIVDNAYKRFAT